MENIEIVPSTYFDSICKALSDAEHLLQILNAEIDTPINGTKTKKKHKYLVAIVGKMNTVAMALEMAKAEHEN